MTTEELTQLSNIMVAAAASDVQLRRLDCSGSGQEGGAAHAESTGQLWDWTQHSMQLLLHHADREQRVRALCMLLGAYAAAVPRREAEHARKGQSMEHIFLKANTELPSGTEGSLGSNIEHTSRYMFRDSLVEAPVPEADWVQAVSLVLLDLLATALAPLLEDGLPAASSVKVKGSNARRERVLVIRASTGEGSMHVLAALREVLSAIRHSRELGADSAEASAELIGRCMHIALELEKDINSPVAPEQADKGFDQQQLVALRQTRALLSLLSSLPLAFYAARAAVTLGVCHLCVLIEAALLIRLSCIAPAHNPVKGARLPHADAAVVKESRGVLHAAHACLAVASLSGSEAVQRFLIRLAAAVQPDWPFAVVDGAMMDDHHDSMLRAAAQTFGSWIEHGLRSSNREEGDSACELVMTHLKGMSSHVSANEDAIIQPQIASRLRAAAVAVASASGGSIAAESRRRSGILAGVYASCARQISLSCSICAVKHCLMQCGPCPCPCPWSLCF
jgi:hypothetical protein